jgi:hypothetical protein
MLFGRPIPFQAAIESAAVRSVLPTTLTSAQYRALGGDLLRQTQISATVQSVEFLDQVQGLAVDLAAGKTNYATARAMLQRTREGLAEEQILDDARLDLILRTQRELAQGYGQFIEGQDPAVIEAFPCAELFRLEDRQDKRDWAQRWTIAARTSGDVDALRVLDQTGRMIARKDSGIWQALGDGAGGYTDTLGNPFPPFAFRSGMWTRDVARSEALDLGLITETDTVQPVAAPNLAELLAQPLRLRSATLRDQILAKFGDAVKFNDGVLTAA